ncbi:hypothetical protein KIN20_019238 [Parelaphostrongylus tenuis]|uniref:Uncharacterized protein n=1 Tax=Parelaphostrongylus tenuis TaxID=148309 RepID=A0AAD5N206_PARTN|nr:hypothetical protein KIN20_019238 [Parelaphostrongylus tenuis]
MEETSTKLPVAETTAMLFPKTSSLEGNGRYSLKRTLFAKQRTGFTKPSLCQQIEMKSCRSNSPRPSKHLKAYSEHHN